MLHAYFAEDAPVAAVRGLADPGRGVRVDGPHAVPDQDWERSWREGLAPRRIGPLWIRPSWCAPQTPPELVIDPEQAFGSGEHATTRLALALLLDALEPGDAVLDLGTGSGILALASLRVGAAGAVGLEIDRVACRNAAGNRERNGLPLGLVCGSLDALAPAARFPLVVANMLSLRLAPWLDRLARHCTRALIVAGYLEHEREALLAPLVGRGWRVVAERSEQQSGDLWGASRLAHERLRQASRSSASVSSSA